MKLALSAITGSITGFSLYFYRDDILTSAFKLVRPIDTFHVIDDTRVFENNENKFYKGNLVEFYKYYSKPIYCYRPSNKSQGHFNVSHGGFTGSMVEYIVRHYFTNMHQELKEPKIVQFYLRYKKPMFVYRRYAVELKDDVDKKRIAYNIKEDGTDDIYSEGYVCYS